MRGNDLQIFSTVMATSAKAQTIVITGKKMLQKGPETEKKFGLGWD